MITRSHSILAWSAAQIVLLATLAVAEPAPMSQKDVANTFRSLCLDGFPNEARIPAKAKSLGLVPVTQAHWRSNDHRLSAAFFPENAKSTDVRVETSEMGVAGWDAVTIKPVVRRSKGACVVYAVTPPKNLYQSVVADLPSGSNPKGKTKSSGLNAEFQVEINGTKAKIVVSRERLQGVSNFAKIIVTQ